MKKIRKSKKGKGNWITPTLHAVEAQPRDSKGSNLKMADDREPPALFDDDVDTQETKTDEPEDTNPFNIGETTEITLDDGTTNELDSSTMNGEGPADTIEDLEEETGPLATGGAASVDVTNLSKPSDDESELPSKEKPEVSLLKYFGKFVRNSPVNKLAYRCVYFFWLSDTS